MELTEIKQTRRSFSLIGFSFVILSVVAMLVQILMVRLPGWIWGEGDPLSDTSWWMWLCTSVPMYLFAFPACWLVMQLLPAKAPAVQPLSRKQFLTLIPICLCLMYGGNIIGTVLSFLLSGGKANNAVMDAAMDQSPLKVLVMVILAPLLEELICRKLLIDRTLPHGEKLSILMSGLIFGLLHQNLFQFFYAFALGSLFAWVYVKTGRVRYTVLLHTMVNFLGAVVAPLILSALDQEALTRLSQGEITVETVLALLPGWLLLSGYGTLLMGGSVFGLVLLIIRLRGQSKQEPDPGFRPGLKAALVNVGMILYMLLCTAMTVWALFPN